jgi:membrane protease YdiL (CAAX protease family)
MSQMPVNKKEHLIYTFLMVIVMAGGMTTYNIVLENGMSVESLKKAWLIFPITYFIAFAIEWLFIGKIAFMLISKVVKEDDHLIKKILLSALCFVTLMVLSMSFITTVIFKPSMTDLLNNWLKSIPRNFAMAFPLQVLIAGPLVNFIFRKLFPVGTITMPE